MVGGEVGGGVDGGVDETELGGAEGTCVCIGLLATPHVGVAGVYTVLLYYLPVM